MIVFNVFDEKKSGEVPGLITFMEKKLQKVGIRGFRKFKAREIICKQ